MKIEMCRGGYSFAWFTNGEEGAWIGQDHSEPLGQLQNKLAAAKKRRNQDGREDYEYLAVEIAARAWVNLHLNGEATTNNGGYEFDSAATAKKFAAAMRAAANSALAEYDTGVPWPEWAKQATAAGWKAPKGWKP